MLTDIQLPTNSWRFIESTINYSDTPNPPKHNRISLESSSLEPVQGRKATDTHPFCPSPAILHLHPSSGAVYRMGVGMWGGEGALVWGLPSLHWKAGRVDWSPSPQEGSNPNTPHPVQDRQTPYQSSFSSTIPLLPGCRKHWECGWATSTQLCLRTQTEVNEVVLLWGAFIWTYIKRRSICQAIRHFLKHSATIHFCQSLYSHAIKGPNAQQISLLSVLFSVASDSPGVNLKEPGSLYNLTQPNRRTLLQGCRLNDRLAPSLVSFK